MSYVVYCANVDVVDAIPHELFQEVLVKSWSNINNTSFFHGHEGVLCTILVEARCLRE